MVGYDELREEQAEARARGQAATASASRPSPRSSAPGPRKDYDILGLKMNDCAELRVHPTGKAILKLGVKTQGQGHETTFAQIVAEELGIPPEDIKVMHGDTDNTPYGLGTYASRSTPVVGRGDRDGGPPASREKAKKLAAHLLEVDRGRHRVRGRQVLRARARPTRSKTIQDVAFAAYTNFPDGHGGRARGRLLLRPAEPDVPVRDVRRGRSRSTPTPACGRCGAWSRSTTAACGSTR